MSEPLKPTLDRGPSWRVAHLWQIQAVRDILLVVVAVGVVWLGYKMRAVTTPLLAALLLAYLFEPLVVVMTRRNRMSRPFAVSLIIIALTLSGAVAMIITVPLVIGQTAQFVHDMRTGHYAGAVRRIDALVPEQFRDDFRRAAEWGGLARTWDVGVAEVMDLEAPEILRPEEAEHGAGAANGEAVEPQDVVPEEPVTTPLNGIGDWAALDDEQIRRIVREELLLASANLPETGKPTRSVTPLVFVMRSAFDTVVTIIGALVHFGLVVFLIPFYFFFFSVSYPRVVSFAAGLVPRHNRERVFDLVSRMDRAAAGFVRGRLLISFLIGILLAMGWTICGVPYSIVLGLVVGIFNIVPYLSGVGWPLAVGLLALEQIALPPEARMSWFWILTGPSLVFIMSQFVDGYVLTPLIAGKVTNLDPVTIVVAVLAGGSLAGVYGMLLAVPVAACLKILLTEVVMPRVRAWAAGKAEDPLPLARE